jgi:hypothetical protein
VDAATVAGSAWVLALVVRTLRRWLRARVQGR